MRNQHGSRYIKIQRAKNRQNHGKFPQKSTKITRIDREKKIYIFFILGRIWGSHETDPDPYQNETDPKPCTKLILLQMNLIQLDGSGIDFP